MPPNIMIIILDTLRKDYGEQYLSDLLEGMGFVYYPTAIAPSPWTLPSHASLFTGKYPLLHRAHETKCKKFKDVRLSSKRLLTTELKALGYTTYLFSANVFITPYFGFRHFDEWQFLERRPPSILSTEDTLELSSCHRSHVIKRGLCLLRNRKFKILTKALIQKTINSNLFLWMYGVLNSWPLDMGLTDFIKIINEKEFNTPFFIFVNLMEMHEPYPTLRNHSNINKYTVKSWVGSIPQEIIERYKKGYTQEIKYLSKKLQQMLKALRDNGLLENTLVIITSDHGQLLGEHGKINHGTFLHDELIRIPLWIKYPEHVTPIPPKEEEFVSLSSLREFIIEFAEREKVRDFHLPTVFSETYGTHLDYSKVNLTREERIRMLDLEKYRIAIYYKNFKGIFNVTDWKLEDVISYKSNTKITGDVVGYLKKEILKFLKTATVTNGLKIKL